MYSEYVNNFDAARERLATLESDNLSFSAFLTACEKQKPCRGLRLRDFLILPVQVDLSGTPTCIVAVKGMQGAYLHTSCTRAGTQYRCFAFCFLQECEGLAVYLPTWRSYFRAVFLHLHLGTAALLL